MAKTILITGGTGGIGAAEVEYFARKGWNVAFSYHSAEKKAQALCEKLCGEGLQAAAFRADLSRREEAFALVEKAEACFGGLDVLLNNAGIAQFGLFQDMTEAQWRQIAGVNLDGSIYCAQAAAAGMVRRGGGVILNTSSMWGQVGASCEVAYSVTKAALIGLTKALAQELGPSGIRVNCIAPGFIETEMNGHLSAEDRSALFEETPLGRGGTPEEVARTAYFLASEGSSFITGQVVAVNGGFVV